ncbi:hypothetical protein Acor_75150 [Acrocarpospora corrugata]|uniref:SGNH hydrolase-type esterase domain-containing protein n=1 Tax=Acrocarpospora corrugata TaxID=35763 RepID=A0A5M3W8P5_9ACTN|nr:hypothetical protein Acor_75150 [Acrocarpospora corrugata]
MGHGVDQVLAVVDQQQALPAAELADEDVQLVILDPLARVEHRAAPQPDPGEYGRGDLRWFGDGREVDEPGAVAVFATAGGLQREPGLPGAAGAEDGDQAPGGEQGADAGEVVVTADEAGQRRGQVGRPDLARVGLAASRRAGRGRRLRLQGISGNRLLNDGIGVAALARFDRDVLATPGLGYVVLSVGANDIGISFAPRDDDGPLAEFLKMFPGAPVTTDDVIAGYRQLIARAHERGVRVYATTIAPYEGTEIYTPEGESARQVVNEWIRTGGAFDAVQDFDAVWRDPAHPSRIREDFHAGDHLHGSDAGYRALADSVDLSLFS